MLNAKRSLSRRRSFAAQFTDDPDRAAEGASTVMSPAVEVDYVASFQQRETGQVVEKAISRLPLRQRRAIELVHFHGLTYAKAAEEMETTRKAVKSLLGRGRTSLRMANGTCMSCFVRVRPQMFQEVKLASAVHNCGNCRRFLYYEPSLKKAEAPAEGEVTESGSAASEAQAVNGGAV